MRRLSLLVKTSFCLFILTSSFLPHLGVLGLKREIDGTNIGVPTHFPLDKSKEVERLDGDGVEVAEANGYFWIDNENSTKEISSWNNPHEKPEHPGLGDFPYGRNEPLVESPNDSPSDCESIGESVGAPKDSFQGCGSVDKTVRYGSGGSSGYDFSELLTSRNMEDVLVLVMSKTVYVNGSNVGDPLENGSLEHPFDKIQEGVNNAISGDTVYVFAGTYKEHLTVNKALSLIGDGRESVLVDGEGTGNCIYSSEDVLVSKLTVGNGSCGIYLSSCYGVLKEVTIEGVGGSGVFGDGGVCLLVDDLLVEDCVGYGIDSQTSYGNWNFTLTNSVIRGCGGGVHWHFDSYSRRAFVENNVISDNGGDGLKFWGGQGKSAVIRNNLVMNNSGDGVYCYAESATISNNTVVNSGGIGILQSGGVGGTVSTISNNSVVNSGGHGMSLEGDAFLFDILVNVTGGDGLYVGYGTVSVKRLIIENVGGSGVFGDGGVCLLVDDLLVEDCVGYGIDSQTSYGNWNFTLTNSVIRGCGGGVHWHFDSYSRRAFVENNTIMDNGGNALRLSGSQCKSAIIKNNLVMNNTGNGIYCYSESTTISNNVVINSTGFGIYVSSSVNALLLLNRVEVSGIGIYLDSVSNATLVGNVMLGNTYNFGVLGLELNHFTHNITTSNTVNGKPIYYLVGIQDTIIDFPDAGFVGIVNSVNITVQNLALANNVEGILFAYVNSSSIRNVSVQDNEFGILFACVSSSGIRNVNVQSNVAGVTLLSSTFNYVIGNNISDGEIGILTLTSYLNFIYQNNFIDNNQSAYVDSDAYINSWDNGYPNGGNYWSDHNCVGDPSDGSQPYFIYGNVSWNVDRYPFQHPINLEASKGNLRIRVTDSGGNPIEGALVTASYYQLVSFLDLQGITDSQGYVYFNDIISGTYILYLNADGYYPTIQTSVVTIGQNNSENLTLLVNPQTYECWALIVGVAYYRYINDAPLVDYTALALYNRLYPIWGKDHIKLLLNEDATKQNINNAIINWLAPRENQDDQVLVFFSGHGGFYNSTYPPYEYICPYDFYNAQSNAITDSSLNDWLNILDSQKTTVILDSCYSGGFIPELSEAGRIILAACRADETALTCIDLQHSLFTHYLLTSFVTNNADANMDGRISWQEIFSYVEPEVTAQALKYEEHEQHPQKYYGYPEEPIIARTVLDTTPPVADAGPDQTVDEGTLVYFNGAGSSDNVEITSYVWAFIDGTLKTLAGKNLAYTFYVPGIYLVTLNVTDAAGNWDTDTLTITVLDKTPPTIGTPSQDPSDAVDPGQVVKISVSITDAGSGVNNVTILYTINNGSSWETPRTMNYNATTGYYETTIPGQPAGTLVKYEIVAYDNAGNHKIENNAGQYYVYSVIPEFPSLLIPLLFMVATLISVSVHKKKRPKHFAR
jgi:parallel beta-helix repeat protein